MTYYGLKNCPLCKGIARPTTDWDNKTKGVYGIYIQCSKCGYKTISFQKESEARKAWNNQEMSSYAQINLLGSVGDLSA